MSGTKRIQYLITGNGVDVEDKESLGYWVNRLVTPIAKAVLSLVNRLAGDAITVTTDTTLQGFEGLVLVNAAGGAVTITLSAPTALFHPLFVQKIDATANPVTISAPSGVALNTSATLPLAAQWDRLIIVADDSAFYA